MKKKFFTKVVALAASIAMTASAFAGLAVTASAAGTVYYSENFEAAADTSGWTSQFAAGDMSIGTDTNAQINKYFRFANTASGGHRTAYHTFSTNAQTLSDNKSVIEFDFFMTNSGVQNTNQLVLMDSSVGTPIGNNMHSGNYIFSLVQLKDATNMLVVNSLDGSVNTYTTNGWSNSAGWTHAKAVMDFAEHTVVLTLTNLDGSKVYFDSKMSMGNASAKSIGKLFICEARGNSATGGIDNIVVRAYDAATDAGEVYYKVTYSVKGAEFTESVKAGEKVAAVPDTTNYGYILKGWVVNDDENNLITDLSALTITADTKLTAVYEADESYIEPIVSMAVEGPDVMELGPNADTAAVNAYSVKLVGEKGTDIVANPDSRVTDFDVKWEFLGFKTANDMEGQYCDSYGAVSYAGDHNTTANFNLRGVAFNFYGKVKATVTYNGQKTEAYTYAVVLGDKSVPSNQILPEAGYVSDFSKYSDEMTGYTASVSANNLTGSDLILGNIFTVGSDAGKGVTLMQEGARKFLRSNKTQTSKSAMATHVIDAPAAQIIMEQEVRFNSNGGTVKLTEGYPIWNSSRYKEAISLVYSGSNITLNGQQLMSGDAAAVFATGTWYKVVISADKSTETAYAKVYDLNGALVGEVSNVAWVASCNPTYYSFGVENSATGTIDFNNYRVYTPVADANSYSIAASQDTLSIPNGDTAELTASLKSVEGYDITSTAAWSVVEEDMREGVILTPDKNDSHKVTVTLSDTASAGTATVMVNIGGYTRQIELTITSSAESVKFTKSNTSVSIPLDDKKITAEYEAVVIDGEGKELDSSITLAVYDKANANPFVLPEGIEFDAAAGVLSVSKAAKPVTFTIRATGLNTDGEAISRAVRVTVHGLAFDFGTDADDAVAQGYTAVTADTVYTAARGYGISGAVTAGGTASAEAASDYLEGSSFEFKANVTPGELYRVTVDFSGDLVTEYHDSVLAGHTRTLEAESSQHTGYTIRTSDIAQQEYLVPVVDEVLDLRFTNAKVAAIFVEKVERVVSAKPSIYSVGDSTLGNNGSYGYVLARDQANYPELTAIATYNNNGKGSRTLSTYYTQGWLDNVLSSIKPGDIVTIGNMGTNAGGLSGSAFKAPMEYYVDACIAMGAKVILTSYTPHGAVGDYTNCYNSTTHTFSGMRTDAYDSQGIRVIYEEKKNNPNVLGFIDIGKMADDAFTAYVADWQANGYDSADAAAAAIIACFSDHNHYNGIACQLMLNGYEGAADGIVKSLVNLITAQSETSFTITECSKNGTKLNVKAEGENISGQVIFALYKNGTLVESAVSGEIVTSGTASAEFDAAALEGEYSVKAFIWDSVSGMKPAAGNDTAPVNF